MKSVVWLLSLAIAAAATAPANMNGEYLIANPNLRAQKQFSSDYGSRNAEYFDVYTPPIRTVYGEVYWTMMDPIPIPAEIKARFANKTMAVVGYEVDQVYVTPEGDKPVPIIWAYNHHYEAYMLGAHAKMEQVTGSIRGAMGNNHGAPTYWKLTSTNPNPLNDKVPDAQFFSEGNGGEFRKSFHGYPSAMAQLIFSPEIVKVQPMQIDTHNRDYNGTGFKAGLLPRSSGAPPNATYSGLLECPCTTRIVKKWSTTYATQTANTCAQNVLNATECFLAPAKMGFHPTNSSIIQSNSLPSGCIMLGPNSSTVLFNTVNNDVPCGLNARTFTGTVVAGSEVTVSLTLDATRSVATITLTGPADVWFGVGWNASAMGDLPYAIIVEGNNGNVTERRLGDHDPGSQLQPTQVRVVSSKTISNTRTVVLTRALAGLTPSHYTFNPTAATLPLIYAVGNTPKLAFHKTRGGVTLSLAAMDGVTCICNLGTTGTINGLPFKKNCAPEPYGDLAQQHNPTCNIETYAGGLSCCYHGQVLLDADQPVDNRTDEYHLKFRFWFQDYTPSTPATPHTPALPPSHGSLHRFYYTTEAWAGEYDIVKCRPETPAQECVQEITARWKVRDMVDCTFDPFCGDRSGPGINLVYAGGHCHAPSCISMELYNMDTGELLCRQEPVYGKGSDETYDELGYLALPPCLWGSEEEGLVAPTLLTWDTNLFSIKRNNNTYAHYGEMASWQMRGVFV